MIPSSPARLGECTLERRRWPLAVAIAIELGGGAVGGRMGDELEADIDVLALSEGISDDGRGFVGAEVRGRAEEGAFDGDGGIGSFGWRDLGETGEVSCQASC